MILLILAEIFLPPLVIMGLIVFFYSGPILLAPTMIFSIFVFIIWHSSFHIINIIEDGLKSYKKVEDE